MKTYQKQKEPVSHTIQSKLDTTKQASPKQILQRYQEETAQRQELDEDELLQGKFREPTQRMESNDLDEEDLLQGKFETTQLESSETSSSGDLGISQRVETDAAGEVDVKPNNTGLPDELKTGIENLSGYSMDDVHVHYNSNKPAQLQALAYTQGTEIHVAPARKNISPTKPGT